MPEQSKGVVNRQARERASKHAGKRERDLHQLHQWRALFFEQMKDAGLASPELDARLLLCHGLGLGETDYFADPHRSVTADQGDGLREILARRLGGEPVSRIIGRRAFWKHEFELGSETLDPRADSETLIETALALVADPRLCLQCGQKDFRILDLGTGSGALLISLLLEMPDASGVGVDISREALQVAQANALQLGCRDRVEFLAGDWLRALPEEGNWRFDLVVCNPPYIPRGNIDGLKPEVALFDPRAALDGGEDGLDPYRKIIPDLARYLPPGGVAIFEIGEGQERQVAELFDAAGFVPAGAEGAEFRDLAGTVRCLAFSLGPEPVSSRRNPNATPGAPV